MNKDRARLQEFRLVKQKYRVWTNICLAREVDDQNVVLMFIL